ncbi:MAG: GTPase HflX [Thermoplasmatales archaeon]|nr:GTPase HflX [Thermoplasmatales archaeon]
MKTVLVMLGDNIENLNETELLGKTMGYDVLHRFIQNKTPRIKFLIGSGKVEEIKGFVKEKGVELGVFENLLTSSQILALEDELKIPVMDRFDLILNVFEKRARSREAKMQIELARLKRKKPYIKTVLGRRVKTEHPGYGGSGEFIIHSTMTEINNRIRKIETALEKFEKRVDRQREKRKEKGRIVSLAGYTNVGKTTLLNALTGTEKDVKDEMFTTLRTKTSSIEKGIFLNDTIGFIRDLPHDLIYAFRATLGDIKNSDLILLVLDASEETETFLEKKSICEGMLEQIKADTIPTLHILNKVDKIDGDEINNKKELVDNPVEVSALYRTGINELKRKIRQGLGT